MRAVLAVLAMSGLAACGGLQWPPPPQLSNPPRAVQTQAKATPPASVTVTGSDTLFSISKRTGVSARAIIDANNLQPPYRLAIGQRLMLPAPRVHTVARGDTLYGISRSYGVDAYELARLNMILPPYLIRVNQRLVLPGGGETQGSVEVADRSETLPAAPAPAQAPALRKVEVVESAPPSRGSSPQSAAESVQEIAAPALPPGAGTAAPTPPPQDPTQLASLPPQSGTHTLSRPGRAANSRFIWPVEGKIASEYGSKGDGLHNDGINIAAPRGTPVRAAAGGIVAYAGNEIRGFGNLLLIRHADGWMTAYAHNEKLLVRRGDKVEQGQEIARVGVTGNVVSPQLHFEIRRGKRAVDPLDQLGSLRSS